ncbi:hypothetical protein ACFLVS_03415 [Chloroflexota bacterium]
MSTGINQLGTKFYKIFAGWVAKEFAKVDHVRGVYIRRGLAKDDIVFGRSDIDLIILIDQFDNPSEESKLIYELSKVYRKFKRYFPILGEVEVHNFSDLMRQDSYRNYRYISDGRFIPLHGTEISLPEFKLEKEDILYEIPMFMFYFLPMAFRSNNIKSSINVLLEISMLYHYLSGEINQLNLRKSDILELLISRNPQSKELRRLRQAFFRFFVGRYADLRKWAYKQCLILGDNLSEVIPEKLEGQVEISQIRSLFCPSFSPRRYLVLDSPNEENMENGLKLMDNDPGLVLTTANILNIYLYYCYPWEYYPIKNSNPLFGLSAPPSSSMQRYLSTQIGKKYQIRVLSNKDLLLWDMRNLVAQAKLYFDHNIICVDKRDLVQKYESHYGIWPYTDSTSLETYLLHDYPTLWESVEELCSRKS